MRVVRLSILLLVATINSFCLVGLPLRPKLLCPEKVGVHLGEVHSMDAGDRASIKKLSESVESCPKAIEYYISWRTPPVPEELGWRALVYRRENTSSGWVGHEYDPGSGTGSLFLVSDESVHNAAKQGGSTRDLAKYMICESDY